MTAQRSQTGANSIAKKSNSHFDGDGSVKEDRCVLAKGHHGDGVEAAGSERSDLGGTERKEVETESCRTARDGTWLERSLGSAASTGFVDEEGRTHRQASLERSQPAKRRNQKRASPCPGRREQQDSQSTESKGQRAGEVLTRMVFARLSHKEGRYQVGQPWSFDLTKT